MTPTDTDALIQKMVQAIYDAIPWDGAEPIPLDEMAAKDWMERDAAAVLPILRRAQIEAWENGRRAGFASAIDRTMPTIGPDANPYRTEQTNG